MIGFPVSKYGFCAFKEAQNFVHLPKIERNFFMENYSGYVSFLELWNNIMYISAIASVALGLAIVVQHKIKSVSLKDAKDRFDYLKAREPNKYFAFYLMIGVAIFLVFNTVNHEAVTQHMLWFFVRFFIGICIGTLIAYVAHLVIKFYYPGRLERKLTKLRYRPRISSRGNEMRLLSEEEEDVHLDEGMQAEEDAFSIDYDVWVEPETGEVKIEKYPGNLQVLQCRTCGFHTMKLKREEITKTATEDHEGELLKHYKCAYCKSVRTNEHTIAKVLKSTREYTLPIDYVLKGERSVASIMIEMISNKGEKSDYYFQNRKEASKFLDEFEYDKVQ